ncbi:MAG: hypothetical protein HQK92_09445 [Nitrospirae bacterium]|nr:hypothetical protein [Nitrospirota bacterium]
MYDILEVSGVIDIIASDHIFDHKKNSLKNIVPLLDMKKCINCKCRIFTECDINKSIGLKIYSDDEGTDYVGHCIPVYEAV